MRAAINSSEGFTLVEVIAAIIVMGVMAVGVVDFISNSAVSYVKTANRNQVSSAGRVVIDRIAMELHNALPYSVRTTTPLTQADEDNGHGFLNDQCIEFLPLEAASTYLNPRFRPAAASSAAFEVINFVPSQLGETDRYAVIYPTSDSDLYKNSFNAPSYPTTEALVALATIADGTALDGKELLTPAGSHRFRRRSPEERIFITTQPVSFCVSGNKLHRYSNYGFYTNQRIPFGPDGSSCKPGFSCITAETPTRVLVTDQVDNSAIGFVAFDYLDTTRRRNAVIQIKLNFNKGGEVVMLNHEVLQQATP
jgi:MSHA biogenesis protein MshO